MVKAMRKITSAIFSYRSSNISFSVLIDKKDNKLDAINNKAATPVNSSIKLTSLYFEILSDVKTTKQNPNKLDEVFRIWDDLLFFMLHFK